MKNRSLTIMFTDMQGFTPRTSSQSRAETMDLIHRHKDLLVPVVEQFGGHLVKAIGDSFLVVFESPTDGVLAGVALQDRLREYNDESPEEDRIVVRLAINTGEVTVDGDDVYGETVNIASRIEGIAEPGDVYFTEATYLSMNKKEVPSAEIGYRMLKGIPEKIKVYKVLREGGHRYRAAPAVVMASDGSPFVPAPNWRRIAAFFMDIMLVHLVMLPVTGPAQLRVARAQADLDQYADSLAELAKEFPREEVFEVLWGNEDDPTMPHYDKVRDFRARRDAVEAMKIRLRDAANSAAFVIFFLYQVIAVAWKGRSLGKRIVGLRVIRIDGNPAGFGKSLLRTLLYLLSAFPFFLGFIWALFDKKRQGWHDKIVETRVVLDQG
jgi:class 3 adenylate cyclase